MASHLFHIYMHHYDNDHIDRTGAKGLNPHIQLEYYINYSIGCIILFLFLENVTLRAGSLRSTQIMLGL